MTIASVANPPTELLAHSASGLGFSAPMVPTLLGSPELATTDCHYGSTSAVTGCIASVAEPPDVSCQSHFGPCLDVPLKAPTSVVLQTENVEPGIPAPISAEVARPTLNLSDALRPGGLALTAAASPVIFKFVLEFLDDTGAGRFITSRKELTRQGIPRKVLDQLLGEPTDIISFKENL